MTRTITDLDHKEAFDFLMAPEQYCTTELPEYFDFSQVLSYCREALAGKPLPDITEPVAGINLDMLTNKDGGYGVRPISISNPFLYTFLARTICEQKAWKAITDCFKAFAVERIDACSIPVVPDPKKQEPFHKSTTILNWWTKMEQRPIELSLEYRHMFVTDITNCFGQIMPRSIEQALCLAGTEAETDNHALARDIIRLIEALQGGRNIGIPQGGVIFSFIAEIVLGYADLLLDKAIKEAGIKADYRVLRYVDDYRIFCNDRDALERISFILQRVLEGFNFRMNASKTRTTNSIVADAVKPDKAFYIFNTPIINKKGVDFDGFQKHIYFIYQFGRKFPNCGQLKVQLSDFRKRLRKYLNPGKSKGWAKVNLSGDEDTQIPSKHRRKIFERPLPMIATLTQIAAENVTAAHYALQVISILLSTYTDNDDKTQIISKIYNKLRHSPNSAYMQLWLQTLTYATGIEEINDYDVPLCNIVKTPNAELWNNSWLDPAIAAGLPVGSVFNRQRLEDSGQVIIFREIRAYCDDSFDEQPSIDDLVDNYYAEPPSIDDLVDDYFDEPPAFVLRDL